MDSGEAEAIKVKVYDIFNSTTTTTGPLTGSTTWVDNWGLGNTSNITYPYLYWYSHDRYFYQVECPKPRCHQMNWCELDKTVVCTKCGSVLKAVSGDADYEIPVK